MALTRAPPDKESEENRSDLDLPLDFNYSVIDHLVAKKKKKLRLHYNNLGGLT